MTQSMMGVVELMNKIAGLTILFSLYGRIISRVQQPVRFQSPDTGPSVTLAHTISF
jgi:hypothetical protein